MGEFGGDHLSGNFGVRVAHTKEEVHRNVPAAGGVYVPDTVTNDYYDVLPSANFRAELAKNLVGRFAVSRTMARPELGQMAGLDLRDIQLSGTVGNPNLKPIRSNNADVSAEWYFAPRSMVSVGAFYMAIDSYVTFGSGTGVFFNQSQNTFSTYNVSTPVNTTAEVRGIELSYMQALGGGFGVNANYTYSAGKETGKAPNSACATTGNCDMIGLSKNVYNLGAFFENDQFSARVVYNFRSTYLNGADRRSAVYQKGVGTVSASVNYNITKDIAVSLEGKDLNDPMLVSYATTPDQPRAFYKNGRQIYLGVRANF
jgi:iron complex outermembrane receptor protein